MDRPPLLVAPYDAELFGHWWFEGPQWVDSLCRMLHGQNYLEMITPGQYLDRGYALQLSTPNISSWGDKGYHEVWLNDKNDWLYRHLHHAAERMTALATAYPKAEGVQEEALTQLARELLLAQSSDWPFIMTAGTMDRYARARVGKHLERFMILEQQIRENNLDVPWLRAISASDNLFPHLDYSIFQSMESTVPVEKKYEDLAGIR
jgi:1,4-alpha-glucan branching enzyme